MVDPVLTKVFFNKGITLLSIPGKADARELPVSPWIQEKQWGFCPRHGTGPEFHRQDIWVHPSIKVSFGWCLTKMRYSDLLVVSTDGCVRPVQCILYKPHTSGDTLLKAKGLLQIVLIWSTRWPQDLTVHADYSRASCNCVSWAQRADFTLARTKSRPLLQLKGMNKPGSVTVWDQLNSICKADRICKGMSTCV